jgi:hypothetical protein
MDSHPGEARPRDHVLVLLRRPDAGAELDAALARMGARAVGGGLYLVPERDGTAETLRHLARLIRERGGRALVGRGRLL